MTSCGENIRIVKFRTLTKIEAGTFKGDGMQKSGLTVFVAAASFVFVIRSQRVVGVAQDRVVGDQAFHLFRPRVPAPEYTIYQVYSAALLIVNLQNCYNEQNMPHSSPVFNYSCNVMSLLNPCLEIPSWTLMYIFTTYIKKTSCFSWLYPILL